MMILRSSVSDWGGGMLPIMPPIMPPAILMPMLISPCNRELAANTRPSGLTITASDSISLLRSCPMKLSLAMNSTVTMHAAC